MTQLLKYHLSRTSGLYFGGPLSWLGKKQYDALHNVVQQKQRTNRNESFCLRLCDDKTYDQRSKDERERQELIARRQKDQTVGFFGGMFIMPKIDSITII